MSKRLFIGLIASIIITGNLGLAQTGGTDRTNAVDPGTNLKEGVLKDNQTLEASFTPEAERGLQTLVATGLLRGTPELDVLEPTQRSRLRWLP
jgi:hypothetical protein